MQQSDSASRLNRQASGSHYLLGALHVQSHGHGPATSTKKVAWWGQLFDRLAPRQRGFEQVQDDDYADGKVGGRWCPEEEAGWLSRLFFAFVNSLVYKGARKHLEQCDLWDTAYQDEPGRVWGAFEQQLHATATPSAPQGVLWKALCRVHGRIFAATGALKVVHDLIMFAQPYILKQLLHHLSGAADRWFALGLAICLLVAALLEACTINIYFNTLFRMSLHTKTQLLEMLYRKSLCVSSAVKSAMGVGPIVNLQSNDAAKLWTLPTYLHMVWNGPFQIVIVMALLMRMMTPWPAIAGLVVTVAIIPLTVLLGKLLTAARKESVAAADERVKLVTEVITGIKAIKLYAWEQPYLTRITALRETELRAIRRTQLFSMANNSIFAAGPVLVSLAAFGIYTALGHDLTAAVAFPALALFNLLRFPIIMIPNQIMNLIAASVGIGRIQNFISCEEMAGVQHLDITESKPKRSNSSNTGMQGSYTGNLGSAQKQTNTSQHRPAAVVISKGSFAWEFNSPAVLRDVNMHVPAGSLVIVVGPVGSGKSSLLAAVLGELAAAGGSAAVGSPVSVAGSVAYTSQDPWIQNATLRNNVLLGQKFDPHKYEQTVEVCCLQTDLEMLPAGDASEIGEKGVNLSGGQKHRVALARAVYADADVYLLDDPLSAVDAHVGRHLFERCICGHLAGKTRLLVTHQSQYLPQADIVVVMMEGCIAHMGTYKQLAAQGVDLAALLPLPAQEIDQDEQHYQQQQQQHEHKQSMLSDSPGAASGSSLTAAADSSNSGSNGSIDGQAALLELSNAGNDLVGQAVSKSANAGAKGFMEAVIQSEALKVAADAAAGAAAETPEDAGSLGLYSHQHVNIRAKYNTSDSSNTPAQEADISAFEQAAQQQQQQQQHDHLQQQGMSVDAERQHEHSNLLGEQEPQQSSSKLLEQQQQQQQRDGQLIKAEERAKGQVKRSVYLAYLGAWGPLFMLPVAVAIGALIERGLQVLQNYVLSIWSNHTNVVKQTSAQPLPAHYTQFYLTVYFVLGLISMGIVLLRSALLVMGSIAASRSLHKKLLAKMLRLPMSFFDSQPTGRLINRFTKDTESLDSQMNAAVNSALTCLVGALLSIVVVVAVSPWTIVVLILLGILYYRVQALYIATSRELKRLDALAFSPIFQHYGESLAGLATIRAFGRQQLFADVNRAHIEQSNRAWWPIQLLNRWLSMRLELTGAVVVFVCAVAVGVLAPRNAGLAGLALTSALNLTGTLAWMVRQTTELEVNMNSVERMVEYETQAEEAPAITHIRPPANWPQSGAVQAVQLVVRYRPELPPVLKGLSFSVKAGEKVGICGRTGCGKSTLMMVLFRMVEPCGGAVLIDGLDCATLGLADLRSRLSLVPQDPVIFSGTVRSNLDPFEQAGSDTLIWEALRQAGIDGIVRALGAGLDSPVQEGGHNLSSGQRQLLCMARALLRSSRILVLDEATSNVDNASDALIQRTIRSAFLSCTVLTIAHRLHTIADADRVMVLDQGQLKEFDVPAKLMKLPGGVFRGLMQEASRNQENL